MRILLILLLIVGYVWFCYTHRFVPRSAPNTDVPKLVHLIYLPWNKDQKLKENYLDFDKKPYEKLKNSTPGYDFKLWTLPEVKEFVQQNYPEYYDTIFGLPRPTMMVDFLRLLIVYHYGGIYWQYGSTRKVAMHYFMPSSNKKVKLFTELVIPQRLANLIGEKEEIRDGEPEELIRVCNQVFSAEAKHPYVWQLFQKAVENSKKYSVKKDYDILYIGANAMMSKMYNEVGRTRKDVELVDAVTAGKMIAISSKGSWRTDGKKKAFAGICSLVKDLIFT